jgi:predicted GNAT family acetyltransferase
MVSVTRASADDLDAMAPVGHERRNEVASAIANGRCWVVRGDRQVVAHLILGQPLFGRPFAETVFVVPNQRRQGFGRMLVRHFVAMHAGRKVFTSTNTSNVPMRALLAGEGFVESGWIDNLDPGDPEVIYCRPG